MKQPVCLAFLCATLPLLLTSVACESTTDDASDGQTPATGGTTSVTSGGSTGDVKGGATATGGSTATTPVEPSSDDLLIDDFEDGDSNPLIAGGWYGYTDTPDGGGSTLTFAGATGAEVVMGGAGFESQKSLEATYSFDQGTLAYAPFIGIGVSIGTAASPLDLRSYAGISYSYRGGAHTARVETTEVTDYDYAGVVLAASPTWKTVTLPFKDFGQEGWGKKVEFNPSHVTAISFAARGTTGTTATLQVDNLKALKAIVAGPPDMTVNPAAPPADGVLDSLEISNPLQAKAMQYLSRGYNITNWLEQERFTDFTYDESFVEKLAAAGFKSIRLPIDFDLYVESKTGTGDSLDITVNDDLFTILDAFDTWTKTHGLSLTIDYHQYSTLLNKAEPDSVGTAIQLWGKVAEHFASNPREDLFFELLNEPELSFDGTDPTQAEWTAIAEQMIGAIRAVDTAHTIIFGDVEWYGIAKLSKRAVLSDTNVVYAFHTYDPFIFTHQGAGWANMANTHDIPFPYSSERWSQYYSDLGFNSSMESWVLSSVKNYYKEGNRAAIRNKILDAKGWAVANNVPVICNEFGALDLVSSLEDRTRYYTDVIGIFEELAIPWQHWFMIMDDTGTDNAEYRTAMKLDE